MRFLCLVDLTRSGPWIRFATDITTIPLRRDSSTWWRSWICFRNVLSWKLTGSLDTEFCLQALEMALSGGSKPEIFHSDQGCQFTSSVFVARLRKGNQDQLVREKALLGQHLMETMEDSQRQGGVAARLQRWLEAQSSLARFLWRYCLVRPRSPLGGKTPNESTVRLNPVPPVEVNDVRDENCPIKAIHLRGTQGHLEELSIDRHQAELTAT